MINNEISPINLNPGPDTGLAIAAPANNFDREIIKNLNPDPETLHKVELNQIENTTNTKNEDSEDLEEKTNTKLPFGTYIRKNYPTWFNWATILLHTLGGMLPFVSLVPDSVSKKIKSIAIEFSRWGIPAVKLHTGLEALAGKRLFEAIARVLPMMFMPILPFFNFQLAYGLSSGINVVLEHMNNRIGDLKKEDGFAVNNRKVINGFKSMINDLKKGVPIQEELKLYLALGGASLMIGGAIPALLFARNSLNSGIAKFFGSFRSIGGLLGDLSIILFSSKTDPAERRKEQLVGSFYLIPSIMDFMQRWMKQDSDANEVFNHAKTALNTIAEVLWSSLSTDRNIKQASTVTKAVQPLYKNTQQQLHTSLSSSAA